MFVGHGPAVPRAFLVSWVFLLTLLTAPALAADPGANDDSATASPTAAIDVLANDSPNGGPLTLTGNTQGAKGSVSCSALGACFYRANAGATGADSFTYSISNGSGVGTATVTINVASAGTSSKAIARDDDVATLVNRPVVDFDVIANDSGDERTLTGNDNAKHGTVTCESDGKCTYTPNPGYTGTDGFLYSIQVGGSTSAAAVHILVASGNAGYAYGAKGSALGNSGAQWGFAAKAVPEGISGQELMAIGLPEGTASLFGPHTLSGGSLQSAKGWTTEVAGDGRLHYTASRNALLGEALTQAFPRPLPPISQGTGGDGHVPILVGTKVFAFYHHSFPTSVTCVDRATGSVCPGYPKNLQNFGTTDINGPGVVSGSKLWTHLITQSSGSSSIGLFCWDADTDSSCGLTIVDRMERFGRAGASAPWLANGKMWLGGDTGKLYCVDPANGNPCGSLDTGLGAVDNEENYDEVSHANRVFLARRNASVACVDVAAGVRCPGWETPKSFGGRWNVINQHDGSGATVGVCVVRAVSFSEGSDGSCLRDNDPATLIPISHWPNVDSCCNSQGYSNSLEAEAGTRTLGGSLQRGGLGCWDWTTMAPCTGGDYGSDGWITQQDNGSGLPSAYGAAFDGGCVIALGDPGQVFTVDPAGTSPCTSLATGTDRTTIDLRDQRCDRTVGGATWRDVVLSDTNNDEMESVIVTVRDAQTGAVLKSEDLIDGDHTLNLADIDPNAHPAITIDASAKTLDDEPVVARSAEVSGDPWSDGIPPRITVHWRSDPQQACARTTSECGAPATVGVNGEMTSPSRQTASAQLTLQRVACGGVLGEQAGCLSRRAFNIHIRYKAKDIRKITVTYKGKKLKLVRMKPRPVFRVDLRGNTKQRAIIRIRIVTKSGKVLKGIRDYHPCPAKRIVPRRPPKL
jgi:hypothetical protein